MINLHYEYFLFFSVNVRIKMFETRNETVAIVQDVILHMNLLTKCV